MLSPFGLLHEAFDGCSTDQEPDAAAPISGSGGRWNGRPVPFCAGFALRLPAVRLFPQHVNHYSGSQNTCQALSIYLSSVLNTWGEG